MDQSVDHDGDDHEDADEHVLDEHQHGPARGEDVAETFLAGIRHEQIAAGHDEQTDRQADEGSRPAFDGLEHGTLRTTSRDRASPGRTILPRTP